MKRTGHRTGRSRLVHFLALVICGVALPLATTGCATDPLDQIEIHSAFGPSASLDGFGPTFDWQPNAPRPDTGLPEGEEPGFHELVVKNVEQRFTEKGYQRLTDQRPAFWIRYLVQSGLGAHTDWHVQFYEKGTLLIDVISPTDGRLMWRGTASAELDETMTPAHRRKRIERAVALVIDDFPAPGS